jgi:multiple antibiotic resistance protein
MSDFFAGIIYTFAALFIILDPLLSVPIFAAMTKGQTPAEIHKQAFIAIAVAGGLMYLFLLFNTLIFEILGLNLPSFQIAGGILLFILGLQETMGIDIGRCKEHSTTAAGVVIGTPLLCGPGTITTVMLLSKDYGILIPFVAITLALVATRLILVLCSPDPAHSRRRCNRYHGQGARDAPRCDHHQDHLCRH